MPSLLVPLLLLCGVGSLGFPTATPGAQDQDVRTVQVDAGFHTLLTQQPLCAFLLSSTE